MTDVANNNNDYSSDDEQQYEDENLTEKERREIERRRRKNQKKKQSKKKQRDPSVTDTQQVPDPGRANGAAVSAALAEAAPPINGQVQNGVDSGISDTGSAPVTAPVTDVDDDIAVEIDYVPEEAKVDEDDPKAKYFSQIFEAFKLKSEGFKEQREAGAYVKREVPESDQYTKAAVSERILQEEIKEKQKELEEKGEIKLSRRKTRLAMQPSMHDLKASTPRPDVVEWADVTSRDPFLLVELKAYRNTVPVPRHWNAKRKYLAGKRGFERQPFDLPDYIKRTGIMEMRETMWEKQENQSLKQMMRERVRPKMGRIDIDYQKLHDAFFKWQTKPSMSRMGDLYYEGKELEAQMREKKPGMLSDELRIALGMPVGPNAHKFPPPWLIAMQRYGPPPSYPNLKIAGLNCPIPEGCAFGYHAGGWGKPPVDEYGKPLYGDVFGLEIPQMSEIEDETRIERRHWGEIGTDDEESEEESDMDEDEDTGLGKPAPPPSESGFTTPADTQGYATPSGITTVPGVETPDIELRKKKFIDDSSGTESTTPGALYHVIPEKKVDRIGSSMMASTHVYDLSKKQPGTDGVEIALNPDELELDPKKLERRYEEQLRKTRTRGGGDETEDLSDMVAKHSAEQNRKRKAAEQKREKEERNKKKGRDFKF